MSSRQQQALSPRAEQQQVIKFLANVDSKYATDWPPVVRLSSDGTDIKRRRFDYFGKTLRNLVKELSQKGLVRREGDSVKLTERGIMYYALRIDQHNAVVGLNNELTRRIRFVGIEVPLGVKQIGAQAFEGYGLRSITLPDSLTSIGESAFSRCSGLCGPRQLCTPRTNLLTECA